METLQFDLNELVSKEIGAKIEALEKQVESLQESNSKLRLEATNARKDLANASMAIEIFDYLRFGFSQITASKETSDNFARTIQHNQYLFIEKILINLFNIKPELTGLYGDGALWTNLIVNFYGNKLTLLKVLNLLLPDNHYKPTTIERVTNFRMPYDYTKPEVIDFLTNLKSCTNGAYFGVNRYWIEYGAGRQNLPYNLIYMSKHITEPDVFRLIIEQIEKQRSNYYYLYALPKYKALTDEQVQRLGETLLTITKDKLEYEEVKSFISNNLCKFNDKTLEYFYSKAQSDNQYRHSHWQRFPVRYQQRFLMEKSFKEVQTILNDSSCRWSDEQKETFLRAYLNDSGEIK